MPEYQLPGRSTPAFRQLDSFTQAYIEALFFTENDKDGIASDAGYNQMSSDLLDAVIADCTAFQAKAGPILEDDTACSRGTGRYSVHEQAGHDFWLTRNGHGAGFWDGDWSEPVATTLDELSKSFGQFDVYAGDDGKIYS